MTPGVQNYNLESFAAQEGLDPSNLEIKRVYYEAPPAIVRYFDPYAGTGTGMMQMLDSFGFGGYSPAIKLFDDARKIMIYRNYKLLNLMIKFVDHNTHLN